jgi:hypothetical protein
MPNNSQRKLPLLVARPSYRTLDGWALGILIEQGAVTECEHHGHRRDRSDPEAWNRARDEARENPFPCTTPDMSVAAINMVVTAIGETCPDCD